MSRSAFENSQTELANGLIITGAKELLKAVRKW